VLLFSAAGLDDASEQPTVKMIPTAVSEAMAILTSVNDFMINVSE